MSATSSDLTRMSSLAKSISARVQKDSAPTDHAPAGRPPGHARRNGCAPATTPHSAAAGYRIPNPQVLDWPAVPAHGADQREPPRQDVYQPAQDGGDVVRLAVEPPSRFLRSQAGGHLTQKRQKPMLIFFHATPVSD